MHLQFSAWCLSRPVGIIPIQHQHWLFQTSEKVELYTWSFFPLHSSILISTIHLLFIILKCGRICFIEGPCVDSITVDFFIILCFHSSTETHLVCPFLSFLYFNFFLVPSNLVTTLLKFAGSHRNCIRGMPFTLIAALQI